jgi:exosome complex exonuclease DIS3/RRP44
MHGDVVYIETVEKAERDVFAEEEPLEEGEVRGSSEILGKVVGIFKRGWRPVVGTVDRKTVNGAGPQNVLISPQERRTSQVGEIIDQRILISIDSWEKDSNYPSGHYMRKIGELGDK